MYPPRRGKEIADHGKHRGEEDAAEETLDGPKSDQLEHAVRLAAQRRRDDEPDHPGEQEWLAAEQVAQLARDRHHDGRRHQVGGDDPGVIAESVQLGHDSRHGGANDRLVKGGEQERHHGAGHDPDRPPPGQSLRQVAARVGIAAPVLLHVVAHALLLSATGAPVMLPIS